LEAEILAPHGIEVFLEVRYAAGRCVAFEERREGLEIGPTAGRPPISGTGSVAGDGDRRAGRETLAGLARRRRELQRQARAGRLDPDDVSGGTFTVSNLRPFGVEWFTPITNPPEVAVLGVGRLTRRAVAEGDGVAVAPVLPLSLTFDHRAVDGAPAAMFLDAVAARLEDPPTHWLPPEEPRFEVRRRRRDGGAFDLVVIGGGPAGYAGAVAAAEAGARVVLVEKGSVGGVCLNRGCVPTRAALEYLAGTRPTGSGGSLHAHVERAVNAVRGGVENVLADLGVELAAGEGRLIPGEPDGPPRVEVSGRVLEGSAVLLATGSERAPLEGGAGTDRRSGSSWSGAVPGAWRRRGSLPCRGHTSPLSRSSRTSSPTRKRM